MSALRTLAKMLGVGEHVAEDALHSERAARAVLSRRNLFAAAGAMAAGTIFAPSVELIAAPPVNPWAETAMLRGLVGMLPLSLMAGGYYLSKGQR